MCRAPRPNRRGSDSAVTASRTRSRLSSGSPIPMNTTLVRRLPAGGQPPGRLADLVDDLGRLEVASEAELTGRAERAADRAAGLARDAHRVPLAVTGPRRVVHEDRLDERAVREPMERLLGQAAIGRPDLGLDERVEAERPVELDPERRRKGADRRCLADPARAIRPDRVGDLARSVGRLAALGQPGAPADPPGGRRRPDAGRASATIGGLEVGRVGHAGHCRTRPGSGRVGRPVATAVGEPRVVTASPRRRPAGARRPGGSRAGPAGPGRARRRSSAGRRPAGPR